MSVFHLLRVGNDDDPDYIPGNGLIISAAALLCPVGGWLADTRFGRYNVVRYSMWIMWTGIILATISELSGSGSTLYEHHIKLPVIYLLTVIVAVGFGGFQTNIVQLGIDQLTDASTTEIRSFITWYTLTLFISGVTLQYATHCILTEYAVSKLYIKTFAVALCLTLALTLDFLFQHWLIKEHVTKKSLSLIYKVIKFTVKHRHSFETEPGEGPSRFNVAKHMYGGPFTNQQVEDVKSILRIFVIITTLSVVCGGISPVEYATDNIENSLWGLSKPKRNFGFARCYERLGIHYSDFFFTIGCVVLYEFVVYPLFYRCLPSLRITLSRYCLLYTSPSPRDATLSRMPSSA